MALLSFQFAGGELCHRLAGLPEGFQKDRGRMMSSGAVREGNSDPAWTAVETRSTCGRRS